MKHAMERIPRTRDRSAEMFKLFLIFVLGLGSVSFALAELSPLEQKVIGTWQFADATGRIVLRADHTCATMFPAKTGRGWETIAVGTWRIEGQKLIRVEKPTLGPSASADPRAPSVTSKLAIRSVTADMFQVGSGLPLKRVK